MQNTSRPHFGSLLAATALGLALTGCAMGTHDGHSELIARAQLNATKVEQPQATQPVVGVIEFAQRKDGSTQVTAEVKNLKPNAVHGFHVHEKGDCSAPDGMSAGGHFNPTQRQHGAPGQGHVGDLPALQADAKGTARVQYVSPDIRLAGAHSIIGKAVIVHRDPDDIHAQPAGNSGPRLACGVVSKG